MLRTHPGVAYKREVPRPSGGWLAWKSKAVDGAGCVLEEVVAAPGWEIERPKQNADYETEYLNNDVRHNILHARYELGEDHLVTARAGGAATSSKPCVRSITSIGAQFSADDAEFLWQRICRAHASTASEVFGMPPSPSPNSPSEVHCPCIEDARREIGDQENLIKSSAIVSGMMPTVCCLQVTSVLKIIGDLQTVLVFRQSYPTPFVHMTDQRCQITEVTCNWSHIEHVVRTVTPRKKSSEMSFASQIFTAYRQAEWPLLCV